MPVSHLFVPRSHLRHVALQSYTVIIIAQLSRQKRGNREKETKSVGVSHQISYEFIDVIIIIVQVSLTVSSKYRCCVIAVNALCLTEEA